MPRRHDNARPRENVFHEDWRASTIKRLRRDMVPSDKQKAPGSDHPEAFTNRTLSSVRSNGGRWLHGTA